MTSFSNFVLISYWCYLAQADAGRQRRCPRLAGLERLDHGYVEIDRQLAADGCVHVPPERRRDRHSVGAGRDRDSSLRAGNGYIVSRRFTGMAHVHRVCLADGSYVQCCQPHAIHFAAGSEIQSTFRLDHLVTCFHNGRAVKAYEPSAG